MIIITARCQATEGIQLCIYKVDAYDILAYQQPINTALPKDECIYLLTSWFVVQTMDTGLPRYFLTNVNKEGCHYVFYRLKTLFITVPPYQSYYAMVWISMHITASYIKRKMSCLCYIYNHNNIQSYCNVMSSLDGCGLVVMHNQ